MAGAVLIWMPSAWWRVDEFPILRARILVEMGGGHGHLLRTKSRWAECDGRLCLADLEAEARRNQKQGFL